MGLYYAMICILMVLRCGWLCLVYVTVAAPAATCKGTLISC